MDELLSQIEEQKGYPAGLIRRAAAARAQAKGVSLETVLAAWAGVEAPTGAAPAPPPAAAATPPPPAAAATPPAAPAAPTVEVIEPEASPEPPAPSQPAAPEPEPVGRAFPRWLAAAFLVIPSIALLYALAVPNGPACGSAGQLAIDPVTGEATNCDGSPYGAEFIDFFTMGEELYAANCAGCHGAGGGGGTGPAFIGGAVLATFNEGNCAGHVEWVAIGTNAWPDPTYGDSATPVGSSGAVMPGFGNVLTADELAAVVLYERVAFGGEDRAIAESDCGLADAATAAAGE